MYVGSGTLAVWSKALGTLKTLGSAAFGPLNVAPDSSSIVYADHCDADATKGNIAVVGADGTGSVDILTNVVIDETSTTCAPFVLYSGSYLVVSYCQLSDAGVAGNPQIASFDGKNSWNKTVLVTNAGPSSPFVAPGSINVTVDTLGDNVLTVGGGTGDGGTTGLYSQGTASATPRTSLSPFGVPTNSDGTGDEFFYLSTKSAFALFTGADGSLQKATYSSPTSVPTVDSTPLAPAGSVLGVAAISAKEDYELDYDTPLSTTIGVPTSLYLRNLATGTAVQLVNNAYAYAFGQGSAFTTDGSYAVFTSESDGRDRPGGGRRYGRDAGGRSRRVRRHHQDRQHSGGVGCDAHDGDRAPLQPELQAHRRDDLHLDLHAQWCGDRGHLRRGRLEGVGGDALHHGRGRGGVQLLPDERQEVPLLHVQPESPLVMAARSFR